LKRPITILPPALANGCCALTGVAEHFRDFSLSSLSSPISQAWHAAFISKCLASKTDRDDDEGRRLQTTACRWLPKLPVVFVKGEDMSPHMKYLKRISHSLTNRSLLQKRTAHAVSQNSFDWLKFVNLIVLAVFVLSSSYQFYLAYEPNLYNSIASQEEPGINVRKLVRKIEDELTKSEEERLKNNSRPMFEVKAFELEIDFVVRKASEHGDKFDFEVATVDNRQQYGAEQTHRLKLTFNPITSYEGSAADNNRSQPVTEGQLIGAVPPKKGQNK
jgi:hypothetical protein